jgi:hypothetical protein
MGQWSHSDLSQIANAPPCGSGSGDIPRPMGCVRSDGVNTVVFTGRDDHHVHQLHRTGNTWVHTDLSVLAGATDPFILAVTSPTSCVLPGNVFSVVYCGRDGNNHALQFTGGVVSHVDLSTLAAAPRSNKVGPPAHFVRGDGVPAVIYIGLTGTGSDGDTVRTHVDQLALTGGNWVHSDLSAIAQPPGSGNVAPLKASGYVKPNKITAVIHGEGGIKELSLPPNGSWSRTDLFNSPDVLRPTPLRWPMGFVRADGKASVIYYVDGAIHELAFVAGQCVATDLSDAADAPIAFAAQATGPMGYVRGDGVTAVVYPGHGRMHELTLVGDGWIHTDLSRAAGAESDSGYPFAYVRSDGVSSVIYRGTDSHIHELALSPAE